VFRVAPRQYLLSLIIFTVVGSECTYCSAVSVYSDTAEENRISSGLARIDSILVCEDYPAAVNSASVLLNQHPDCPFHTWQIQHRLGLALLKSGQPLVAITHLEAAILGEPGVAASHLNLAAALIALGRRGRAFSEFESAVQLAPNNYRVHLDFGQVMLEFKMNKAALEQLLIAQKLCAGCTEVMRALVNCYIAQQDYFSAIEPLQQLHRLDPTIATRQLLVSTLRRTNELEALAQLLGPDWPTNLTANEQLLLLEAEQILGRFDRAKDMVDMLSSLSDQQGPLEDQFGAAAGQALFWGLISVLCIEHEDWTAGLLAVDMAVSLEPNNVTYLNNRVVLLTKLTRHDEAAEQWEQVLKLDPSLAK